MIMGIAIFVVCLSLFIMLICLMIGPGIFNRILALNCFGTFTITLFCLLAIDTKNESFIDIGLIYGLINFVSTIAFLKYFRYKSLSTNGAND
jgi:multicomponent Na+:H+ antiporter subunit F